MPSPLDPTHLREATSRLLEHYQAQAADASLSFRPIEPQRDACNIAAVDGGSAVVLDVVSVACFAVRAAYTVRRPGGSHRDGPVRPAVHVVRRSQATEWWQELSRQHGWGHDLGAPIHPGQRGGRLWADAARAALELDAAMAALQELREGDLLLLDGSLEDPSGLTEIIRKRAAARGIRLAAVSKDSGRSIGGTLPMPVEVEAAARAQEAPARWYADVTNALGLRDESIRVYGVRFGVGTPVFRVDIPAESAGDDSLWGAIAGACDDPTAPGYPYPLARVHHAVAYRRGEAIDLQRAMESMISERQGSGIGMRLFQQGREVLHVRG